MMSVNNYLFLSNINGKKAGSIIEYRDEEIKDIYENLNNQIIKLSNEESSFYQMYDENVRIERYNAGLFDKINFLQENVECYLKIKNEYHQAKILRRENKNGNLIFIYRNGGSTREVPVAWIADVREISIKEQDKANDPESPRPVMENVHREVKRQLIGDGFYILSKKYAMYQCGVIIRVRDGSLMNIDDKKVIMNVEDVKDYLTKIEKDESRYLSKFPKEKRMKIKEMNIFSLIKNLEVGQVCNLREDNLSVKDYIVTKKNVTEDGIKFDLRIEKSRSVKYSVDESEITYSKEQDKANHSESSRPVMETEHREVKRQLIGDGFYILSKKYALYQYGVIIRVRDGSIMNNDDKKAILNIEDVKDYLIKIENDESRYLSKFPKEKRMEIKEMNIFSLIKNLEVGQECNLREDKYSVKDYIVTKKNIAEDGIKFDLRIEKSRSVKNNVDESEITFSKKLLLKITGPRDTSTTGSITYGRQGSTNSMSSGEFSSVNKSMQGNLKTMFCEPIEQNVINPNQIKKISKDDVQIFDKYLVINTKSKSSVVKLLWKGLVDDQICLGCDILVYWSEGTAGKFNDDQLFSCDKKRGVLIPMDDNWNSCESKSKQHNDLSDEDIIIKEEDICCVETKKDQIKYFDKTIIADPNCKIKGVCKWLGLVNGRESVGIFGMSTGNYRFNGLVDTMKLCSSKLALIQTKSIPNTISCEEMKTNIINPNQMKIIHTKNEQSFDKYIVMNTKSKSSVVKLLWKGLLDDQICLGCELMAYCSEGTDGVFDGKQLFSCKDKRGVLIPESSLVNSCALTKHRDIQFTSNQYGLIKEDCICCVETIRNFPSVNIAIKDKLRYGPNKRLKGSCVWLGKINGEKCVGILDSEISHREYNYKGLISDTGICGMDYSKWAIVTLDSLASFQFVGDLFVNNSNEIDVNSISRESNIYKIGQLIQAGNDPLFYGPVEFHLKYFNDVFVGLKLNEDQITKNIEFLSKIKFEAPFFARDDLGIIVKKEGTKRCKEEVELMNNSKIINKDCIKYKEKYNTSNFKSGDIVKYISGESDDCFRVNNVWMLNKVPCVEVSKATKVLESNSIKYVRAQDIKKYDTSAIQTRYFQDTIIDCETVKVWDKENLPTISVGDQVEFKFRITEKPCKGIVKCTGKANKIPSCIVQLLTNSGNDDAYRINEKKLFRKYCKNINDSMVIVPADILQKINETLITSDSGIPIISLQTVKTVNGKETSEKYISFKFNNKRYFVLLKWKGFVNEIYCFGGEIDGEDQLGTNGNFAGQQLFKCKEKCGVLIPLNKVTDCCLNMKNNELIIKEEKIVETSICCIKTKAKLNENPQINTNERLQKKNSEVNGFCNWIGLVNNKEAVFLELRNQIHVGSSGIKNIFHFNLNRGAFFDASGFSHELVPVPGMPISIINPFNIKAIENGKEIQKIICTKIKQKKQILILKWRGVVNGELCIGCQLSNDVEYGSDGCYLGRRLFTCSEKKGVLIPVDQLGDSCECIGIHKEIEKNQTSYFRAGIKTVKVDCFCCLESLENIQKFPHLCTESRVKHKDLPGTCKWVGLVNGIEAVGVEMDKEFKEGTNGRFDTFDLFTCDPGKGCLFLTEDIIHDVEAEKLHFVEDEVVEIEKIHSMKTLNNFTKFPFKIGDPVITFINSIDHIGELKWGGQINNKSCVGLDLEDAFEHGMNGRICGQTIFKCPEGYGLITPLAKIQYYDVANKLQRYENGLINPYKYMKCEEKYDRRFLEEKKIDKNDLVFVTVSDENEKIRLKGTLRWCGLMNGIPVGAVELNHDHLRGTDGTFWRHRLFQCRHKRAIAVPWDRITQYIPYETKPIPEEIKIFPDININSAVKYFRQFAEDVKDLYGTVRWTGVDETGEYLFGIELDDRIPDGTDGEFLGKRLFHCPFGHGILAPLDLVMKDVRFVEEVVDPVNVEESVVSTERSFGILTRLTEGQNKGIQGNANSCYFDSAIFALFVNTDVLDFMIAPVLNDDEKDVITKEFRDVLAWKIVYPLREKQFVSFHKTAEMRNIILKYGAKFAEMTKQESDMENVSSLLSKLCPTEQLLSIISFNKIQTKSMFLQLFLFVQKKVKFMTSEEMLKMSMVENNIMFHELPSCLIFQAPRDAVGINCYEYVIPSKTIEISEICANHFRKCYQCPNKAKYQCRDCIEENDFDLTTCLYCDSHKCQHELVMDLPDFPMYSKSKVFYNLKAIICIEKCHFVAYVNENDKWFFFDSMSTQSLINNYAIPGITYSKEVSHFLNQPDEQKKNDIEYYNTNEIKRVVKDSYVFIYHNSTRTCY